MPTAYLLPLFPIILYLANAAITFISNRISVPLLNVITRAYVANYKKHSSPDKYINDVIVEVGRLTEGVIFSFISLSAKVVQTVCIVIVSTIIFEPEYVIGLCIIALIFILFIVSTQRLSIGLSKDINTVNRRKAETFTFISNAAYHIYHTQSLNKFIKPAITASKMYAIIRTKQFLISNSPKFGIELIAFTTAVIFAIYKDASLANYQSIILIGLLGYRTVPLAQSIFASYVTITVNMGSLTQLNLKNILLKELLKKDERSHELTDIREIKVIKFEQYEASLNDVRISMPNMVYSAGLHLIHGKSGIGKSTLLKGIISKVGTLNGDMFMDDKPSIKPILLGKPGGISFTNEDAVLKAGSIYENVTFGRNHTKQEVTTVLELVELTIDGVQYGPDHQISSGGLSLSTGQRQKVRLARALINSPSFLMLDESFNGVDFQSVKRICEKLKTLSCITLLITHDMSVQEFCNSTVEL